MNRFKTYAQYEKSLSDTEEFVDSNLKSDDDLWLEYETYKMESLTDAGFTIDTLISMIVQYALENGLLEMLIQDPSMVVECWENDVGCDYYIGYEEWFFEVYGEEIEEEFVDKDITEDECDLEETESWQESLSDHIVDRHDLYHSGMYDEDDPFFIL